MAVLSLRVLISSNVVCELYKIKYRSLVTSSNVETIFLDEKFDSKG